jgi:hypothetical protein
MPDDDISTLWRGVVWILSRPLFEPRAVYQRVLYVALKKMIMSQSVQRQRHPNHDHHEEKAKGRIIPHAYQQYRCCGLELAVSTSKYIYRPFGRGPAHWTRFGLNGTDIA